MELLYKGEEFNLHNNEAAIVTIFKKVHEAIEEKDVAFSHLIVDGVDVYEDHEEYLTERINEIMKVEIATRKIKEMIWETMTSVNEYLERAIPSLIKLVDESYENFSKETWQGIDQLGEGMQWILQFTSFTKESSQEPSNWKAIEKGVLLCEASFIQLLEAVKAKDTVLISDILSYEVTPAYESLQGNLALSLEDEEFLKDVN